MSWKIDPERLRIIEQQHTEAVAQVRKLSDRIACLSAGEEQSQDVYDEIADLEEQRNIQIEARGELSALLKRCREYLEGSNG